MWSLSHYTEDLAEIGGLSSPAKMPCWSWGISTDRCKLGGRLSKLPGTVCSTCYARRRRYHGGAVKAAHRRRYYALNKALNNKEQRWKFVEAFSSVLCHKLRYWKGGPKYPEYFRWFDSGDVQSATHLYMLNEIALMTPEVAFWLPTRELGFVQQFMNNHSTFANNLTVRLSGNYVDKLVPRSYWLDSPRVARSTVMTLPFASESYGSWLCPAKTTNGNCSTCRACWDVKVDVVYTKQ